MNRKIRPYLLIVVLLALCCLATITQIDLSTQAKGVLPVANGGYPGEEFSIELESPAIADTGKFQQKLHYNGVFNRVSCSTDTGTASINLEVRLESSPNVTGNSVLVTPLVCGPSTGIRTSFLTSSFTSDAPIALAITDVSGATLLRVHVQVQSN